jgi:hypothetical protein
MVIRQSQISISKSYFMSGLYKKQYNGLLALGVALLIFGCEKKLGVDAAPNFDVILQKSEYQVGEEVFFNFTGTATTISFYSGEITNDYDHREGRILDLTDYGATFSFSSGVTGGAQEDQISILASSDFNGNYDNLSNVKQATWKDISALFPLGISPTFLNTTPQDISGELVEGKPLYIGIRYLTKPQKVNGLARTWMFQDMQIASTAFINESNPVIVNQTELAFQIVEQDKEEAPSRSAVSGTRITLLGNIYKDPNDLIYNPDNPIFDPENPIYDPGSPEYDPNAIRPEYVPYDENDPTNDPATEHWAISKAITVDKLDLGPDWAQPVKGIRSTMPDSFTHIYSTPGTYKVRFIATNSTIDESRTVIKELTITITE